MSTDRGTLAITLQRRLNELFERGLQLIKSHDTLPPKFSIYLEKLIAEDEKFYKECMEEERWYDFDERVELGRLIIESAKTLRALKDWLFEHPAP